MEFVVINRNNKKRITLHSDTENIETVVSHIIENVSGINENERFGLSLALTEALTNAVIHGNKNNPGKKVYTEVMVKPEKVVLQVTDEGAGFNHENVQDPTREENLLKQNGRGIYFINHFMDEVRYNSVGNEITMVKYF